MTYKAAIEAIEFAARTVDFARQELDLLPASESLAGDIAVLYGIKRRLEHLANQVAADDPAFSIEIAEITESNDG